MMEKLTSEDIEALREYLKFVEGFDPKPPKEITREEWEDAMYAVDHTGELPEKYAGRIGVREKVVYLEYIDGKPVACPEGKKKKGYYDIAYYEWAEQFRNMSKKYEKVVEKALQVFTSDLQDRNSTTVISLKDILKQITTNPELLRELEKEARRQEKQELPALGSVPNGEIINWLYRVLSSKGGRVQQSTGNRHEVITQQQKGDSMRFIRSNKQNDNTQIVEIAHALKHLSKTNKTFAKMFLFTLQKMNAQNFPLEVGFSLQELVDLGMYSTQSNALRAFYDFFAQQTDTMIKGTAKRGRKTVKEEGGVLFYHYKLDNGYIRLYTNENFNMEFIANYFTVFPRFAYALSNNAFNLVRYIFFLARQNTKPIKEKGTFTIGLDAVRENLNFPAPDEVKNRKYKQYIIEPIEAAIEEIEEALQTTPEAKEYGFTITPVGTDTSNINKWLEGYLEIGLKGDFAETFVKIATKAENDLEKWNQLKIAELAKIAAKQEAENEK